MHGLLDVATFGIWEVAGTPIEGKKRGGFYVFKVEYDNDGTVLNATIEASS